jgi:hypothetical protein
MFHMKHPPIKIQRKKGRGYMFNGDIRLARVEDVMKMVRQMTLAEIKAVVREATQYHDSIVLALDPKWRKPDPHWEEDL